MNNGSVIKIKYSDFLMYGQKPRTQINISVSTPGTTEYRKTKEKMGKKTRNNLSFKGACLKTRGSVVG
jgi:hypothetical protein